MTIRAELKGPDIRRILQTTRGALEQMVTVGTEPLQAAAEVIVDVMRDELRQPGRGRIYDCEFRMINGRPVPIRSLPREPHQASAPGDPPATDTGALSGALGVQVLADDRVGIGVTRDGLHWRYLEDGTRFMEPRPFIEPAFEIAKAGAAKAFKREALKQGKRRKPRAFATVKAAALGKAG